MVLPKIVQVIIVLFQVIVTLIWYSISLINNIKKYFSWLLTVHGSWSNWDEYTPCSVTCGGGKKTRKQKCNNPSPAYKGNFCSFQGLIKDEYEEGELKTEAKPCNTKECPSKFHNYVMLCIKRIIQFFLSLLRYTIFHSNIPKKCL